MPTPTEQKKIKLQRMIEIIKTNSPINLKKLIAIFFIEECMAKKTAKDYIEALIIMESIKISGETGEEVVEFVGE